jgi:hypothetical protein
MADVSGSTIVFDDGVIMPIRFAATISAPDHSIGAQGTARLDRSRPDESGQDGQDRRDR